MRAAPFFFTLAAMAMMPFGGQAHASVEPEPREPERLRRGALPPVHIGGWRVEYPERRSEADMAALDAAAAKRARRRARAADLAARTAAGRDRSA